MTRYNATLTILAVHGRLDVYDTRATYSRRPRTIVILGTRYIIG